MEPRVGLFRDLSPLSSLSILVYSREEVGSLGLIPEHIWHEPFFLEDSPAFTVELQQGDAQPRNQSYPERSLRKCGLNGSVQMFNRL